LAAPHERFSLSYALPNHTIGIVLCPKNNSALVEITLPKDANIHAREYQLPAQQRGAATETCEIDWRAG